MDFRRRINAVLAASVLLGGSWMLPMAYGGEGGGGSGAAQTSTTSAAEGASATNVDVEHELQQLRQLVESQQSRIDKLESELNAAKGGATAATGAATPAKASGDGRSLETVAEKQEALGKKVEGLEGKLKGFGPFTFSGDIRLRHESLFGGGPANGAENANRNRERYRLRFNVLAKLNDELSGGFSLASGDLGDPISTNTTETGFFTRTPIAVDRAFIDYKPKFFKPLSVTAGKFAYTWDRTELTFDNDINVEGSSQKVQWNWENRFLSHLGVVGFELPLFEVSGGPDSSILGGQLQTGWALLPGLKITADAAFYDYQNPDTIAQNQTNGNGFATQGTNTGQGGNYGFSAATLTNSVGVIGGKRDFVSGFGILDTLFKVNLDTGIKRFPLTALFNFEQNTRACQNLAAFVAAGVSVTCNPRDRQGYWAEAQFGETKKKGDFSFDYVFARIEREATVSAFVASDFRQPTNIAQHRFGVGYEAYRNVTLDFTTFIGRQLVTAQSATPERWLKRLQMDVNYKF
jgi:hypothetical protein